jgi:hypothetical protein
MESLSESKKLFLFQKTQSGIHIYIIPNNMEFFLCSVMVKNNPCLQDPSISMEICSTHQSYLGFNPLHILSQHTYFV